MFTGQGVVVSNARLLPGAGAGVDGVDVNERVAVGVVGFAIPERE